MDRSCCWKGDFSALLRGKVTFLLVGTNYEDGQIVLLEG